jgi:predicted Zn-dependent protease
LVPSLALAFSPLVVLINGSVIGFDVVSRPEVYARLHDKLVELLNRNRSIACATFTRMHNSFGTALRAASAAAARAGVLGGWLRQQGIQLLRTGYARDGELEADKLGLRLAAAAGFNPAGAITLLRRIERLPSPALGSYFASHPSASERIAALEPLRT